MKLFGPASALFTLSVYRSPHNLNLTIEFGGRWNLSLNLTDRHGMDASYERYARRSWWDDEIRTLP